MALLVIGSAIAFGTGSVPDALRGPVQTVEGDLARFKAAGESISQSLLGDLARGAAPAPASSVGPAPVQAAAASAEVWLSAQRADGAPSQPTHEGR
jgi:hypothetical protein